MALDLSSLDDSSSGQPAAPTGAPLRLPLSLIDPDPNQPRGTKPPEEIEEMGRSIKARGVKLSISVKANSSAPGRYLINDGELRYLGSKWAEVLDIPVVIDEDFDDFDQVNVNEKRFALKPIDLARFIHRKLGEGLKKGEIARRLDKPPNAITELLALIDPPACIDEVYVSGRCTSPKTLYELRALAEKYPEQVKEWCDSAEEITRGAVSELGDILKGKAKKPTAAAGAVGLEVPGQVSAHQGGGGLGALKDEAPGKEKFRHDEKSSDEKGGSSQILHGSNSGNGDAGLPGREAGDGAGDGGGGGESTGTSWPRGKVASDPDLMKRPLLLVRHNGRLAVVLLNRRPSALGLIKIRYEDGGGDAEVAATECVLDMLREE